MIRRKEYECAGLRVLKAWPPFAFEEILSDSKNVIEKGGVDALKIPTIFDLRLVDLLPLTSEDVRTFITRRRNLHAAPLSAGAAFVVGDLGSLGMMRMYAIYSELSGLRDEANTLVTMDMEEAFDWLKSRGYALESGVVEQMREDLEGWDRPVAGQPFPPAADPP